MSLFKTLSNAIPDAKALVPTVVRDWSDAYLAPNMNSLVPFGGGVTLYPADTGQTYIERGYKSNPVVNAIASLSSRKFAQVNFYPIRIKKNETKTYYNEYLPLTRSLIDFKAVQEARKMRTKAVDEMQVNTPLAKLLAKPNRNMTGAQYLESLYLQKILTGEGNQWLSRGFDEQRNQITRGKPLELQIIPKANLQLIKGTDAWDIARYQITISGERYLTPKENIIMWINPNPQTEIDGNTLAHLRGLAPLESARHVLQAYNEGVERLVNINKNQGASGFATREDLASVDIAQAQFIRQQFDSIINNGSMSGKYAVMGGKWAVHQLGMNVQDLKVLEQMDAQTEMLANVMGFPPGLLTKNQTFENARTTGRNWIFNTIAPAAYALRDEWNEKLLAAFDMDRERDAIEAAVLDLPEFSEDLKTQKEAIQGLPLSGNQVLEYLGFDKSADPNMDVIFIANNLQTLEDAAAPMGGSLDTTGLD